MYNHRLTRGVFCYLVSGALFLGGCSRVEEMAERNDKSAEIRINEKQKRDAYTREAIKELGEAIEEMRRDFRDIEDSFKKRRR